MEGFPHFSELPEELQEEVIDKMEATDLAHFLATSKRVREKDLTLERRQILTKGALRSTQAQEFLKEQVSLEAKKMAEREASGAHFTFYKTGPRLTSLLGSIYPQHNGEAIVTMLNVTAWILLYSQLNNLLKPNRFIIIDETLASVAPSYSPGQITTVNKLMSAFDLKPLREKVKDELGLTAQLLYLAVYMVLARKIIELYPEDKEIFGHI